MISMNRILITGANGLIGRATTRLLRKLYPYECIIPTDITPNELMGIYKIDVTKNYDIDLAFRELGPGDTVIHLAALVAGPPSEKRPEPYIYVNVVGTLKILETMRLKDVPKLVFTSSWSTFGTDISLPINETTPQNPRNPYGVSKVMAEKEVKLYAELYGLEVVVLRPTMIYGPEQTEKNLVQQVVDCMETGDIFEIWGEGTHTKELLHVDDMANILHKAALYNAKDGHEVFVVGTECPLSVVDVADAGRRLVPFEIKFVPSNKWVFSQRSSMTKIKEALKINPKEFKSIDEGLLNCLKYRQTGKL